MQIARSQFRLSYIFVIPWIVSSRPVAGVAYASPATGFLDVAILRIADRILSFDGNQAYGCSAGSRALMRNSIGGFADRILTTLAGQSRRVTGHRESFREG